MKLVQTRPATVRNVRHCNLLSVFACVLLLAAASPLRAQVTTTQPAVNFSAWVAVGAATGSTQTLTFIGSVRHHAGGRFGPDSGRTKS